MMVEYRHFAACILIIIFIISSFSQLKAASNDCYYEAQIKISLEIEFENASYRQDWFYENLRPRVKIFDPKSGEEIALIPTVEEKIVSGKLAAEISALSNHEILTSTDELGIVVSFGLRDVILEPRPVRWQKSAARSDSRFSCARLSASFGVIRLENQADPDWVILRHARSSRTQDHHFLIDVELINPTTVEQVSMDNRLGFFDGRRMRCASIGRHVKIPVVIEGQYCMVDAAFSAADESFLENCSTEPKPLTIYSGDALDTTLIKRAIEYRTGGCGEIWTEIGLGSSGPVPPQSSVRLRYVFESEDSNIDHLIYLPENYVSISGGRIWPPEISVD